MKRDAEDTLTPSKAQARWEARVKALKPGEWLLINNCPGLRLVVSASRKTWTYRYKNPAGQIKQVRIGSWPTMRLSEAMAGWDALRPQARAGIDLVAEARRSRRTPAAEVNHTPVGEVDLRGAVRDEIAALKVALLAAISEAKQSLQDGVDEVQKALAEIRASRGGPS